MKGPAAALVKHRLLTRDEERELLTRLQAGDDQARADIVRFNARLAASVANDFQRRAPGIDFEDLFQEGLIGVLKAAERFDLRKDVKFATYAIWWVRHLVGRYVTNQRSAIRVPAHAQRMLFLMLDEDRAGEVSEQWQRELSFSGRVVASLDAPLTDDSDTTLGERVAATGSLSEPTVEALEVELLLDLPCLDDRDRYILGELFFEEATANDVARALGVSRQAVEASRDRALRRLREAHEAVLEGLPVEAKPNPVGPLSEQLGLPLESCA